MQIRSSHLLQTDFYVLASAIETQESAAGCAAQKADRRKRREEGGERREEGGEREEEEEEKEREL